MVVGVKYCGGCNPNYHRRSIVSRAQKEFPHVSFCAYDPAADYDLVVVICGCMEECFTFSCSNSTHGLVWIRSLQEYDRLHDALRVMETIFQVPSDTFKLREVLL